MATIIFQKEYIFLKGERVWVVSVCWWGLGVVVCGLQVRQGRGRSGVVEYATNNITLAAETAASPKWARKSSDTFGCKQNLIRFYNYNNKKLKLYIQDSLTAGASSMIFWCLLCTLQSLSYKYRMFPCLSPNIQKQKVKEIYKIKA